MATRIGWGEANRARAAPTNSVVVVAGEECVVVSVEQEEYPPQPG
jgi:hypothetical protein